MTMMATQAEPIAIGNLLEEIAAESDPTLRQHLVNDFIVATDGLNKSIAVALCRDFKVDRNTWLDDFRQFVRIAADTLLHEIIDSPDRREEIGNWRGLLMFRARSSVTAFIDSAAGFNQASGMVSVKRRIREMEKTRGLLYNELHREPSDVEIVEETNKRMAAIRSDYKRQGMECKVEDLYVSAVAESIDDPNREHHQRPSADTVETESDLHAVERIELVRLCIAECFNENDLLGRIAELWFAPALGDDYDANPTAAEISGKVGIEPSTARAKVSRVRQIAQRVTRDRYGIQRGQTA